jgi:hypothetical protein
LDMPAAAQIGPPKTTSRSPLFELFSADAMFLAAENNRRCATGSAVVSMLENSSFNASWRAAIDTALACKNIDTSPERRPPTMPQSGPMRLTILNSPMINTGTPPSITAQRPLQFGFVNGEEVHINVPDRVITTIVFRGVASTTVIDSLRSINCPYFVSSTPVTHRTLQDLVPSDELIVQSIPKRTEPILSPLSKPTSLPQPPAPAPLASGVSRATTPTVPFKPPVQPTAPVPSTSKPPSRPETSTPVKPVAIPLPQVSPIGPRPSVTIPSISLFSPKALNLALKGGVITQEQMAEMVNHLGTDEGAFAIGKT